MSRNKYWVLLSEQEEPELFTSWPECEKKKRGASRPFWHGFPAKEDAMEFIAGKWRGKPISEEAGTWLEEYKAGPGQLKQDTESDTSALSAYLIASSEKLPGYCAYVDGSYDEMSGTYGFGVVFICDGKIEKFYGGGKEKNLADMKNDAGELLACMEAIKYAETLGWPELTIIYDCEAIRWVYYGCADRMLAQAASQYIYDIRKKMEIKVKSIEGYSHTSSQGPGIALADKLARKGAGL